MPRRILTLPLACLAFAAVANAGPIWLGPQLQFPLPASDIGNTQLGVDGGMTVTVMCNKYVGVGGDVLYHYWPTSADYKSAYNRHLLRTRLETMDGSAWAVSAFQYTAHVKVFPWESARFAPWAQAGMGIYRLNHNLVETRPPDTYAYVSSPYADNLIQEFGGYASIGFDVRCGSRVALGLDASYHSVWSATNEPWSRENDIPNFSAFTVGTHVLFGWAVAPGR